MNAQDDPIIKRLKQQGCRFPISRSDLLARYKRVNERTVQELARRGLLHGSELWDGSLSWLAALELESAGVTNKADFRKKYSAGKLELLRWRGISTYKAGLILAWAGLPVPDDGMRDITLKLSLETCASLAALRKHRRAASRDTVVAQLVAEELKRVKGGAGDK